MDDGEDLERTVGELAATLDELRDELEPEQRPSRVRDLVRFTEQYTIPAVIAILETNIRLLEMLQGAIRLADGRLDREGERTADRAFDALDGAFSDVRDAIAGTPENPEARRLLEEARDLRAEAERRVEERRRDDRPESARQGDDRPGDELPGDELPGDERGTPERAREARDGPHEVPVDVEAELETIKREFDETEDGDEGEGRDGNEGGGRDGNEGGGGDGDKDLDGDREGDDDEDGDVDGTDE